MTPGYKVTLSVGTEYDKHGMPITPTQRVKALSRLRIKLAEMFGGYTETTHNGGWINPDSQLVQETSVSFQMIIGEDKLKLVSSAANWARVLLLQEQVLVTREAIEFEFMDLAAIARVNQTFSETF